MRRLLVVVFVAVAGITVVGDPRPADANVSATVSANPHGVYQAHCPWTFTFHATISVSQAGPISYRWIRSDGARGPIINKNPSTAGHFGQIDTWTLGGPKEIFNGWEQVEFLSPYHAYSNRQGIHLSCL